MKQPVSALLVCEAVNECSFSLLKSIHCAFIYIAVLFSVSASILHSLSALRKRRSCILQSKDSLLSQRSSILLSLVQFTWLMLWSGSRFPNALMLCLQESAVNIMRQFWDEMTQMLTNEFSAVAAGACWRKHSEIYTHVLYIFDRVSLC